MRSGRICTVQSAPLMFTLQRQGPVHQLSRRVGTVAEQQGRGWTPLCNLHEPLRPEGPLCVYVHCFAFASSHVNGQLHREEGLQHCPKLG